MGYWSEVVGQDAAIVAAERAASGEVTPAHAWLITGPPGSGRSTLAARFAAALIARDVSDREQVYHQVLQETHPDHRLLKTDKNVIRMKDAKEVVADSYYAPSQGRYRVVVVEDADRLVEHTSNVLLKALEEPPERTIWMLCAPSEADLLPTIRSRTRSMRLVTPSPEAVARLLIERDGIDEQRALQAARLAQSHIGMARRLATSDAALERRASSLQSALQVETISDAMRAAAEIARLASEDAKSMSEDEGEREREEIRRSLGIEPGAAVPARLRSQMKQFEDDQKQREKRAERDSVDRALTDVLSLYRDVLLVSVGSEVPLVNVEVREHIVARAKEWGEVGALQRLDAVERARERLMRQVTPGLVLEAMFAAGFHTSETGERSAA